MWLPSAIQFFTSTLAAYSLAFMDYKGKSLVFVVIFMQIIIPNDVLITPNFMTLAEMGVIDTKLGIMLPFLGSATAHLPAAPALQNRAARLWRGRQD